ncbi:MAG TPA: tRNA (adenosine(37)-N6)-threonylcarbamoyltransferase complex ATPase subunit type 1 TsaE [Marinobacter sp.]|jgi:tRNA threonylcarbamoyladenosine biosynthesis protein TsaE|nr:tRNA (adenosine(37)-N6)-threonylcarbamoyltransferase complex ATPase subunit type 1 TsaE [Marinobacter sp.]
MSTVTGAPATAVFLPDEQATETLGGSLASLAFASGEDLVICLQGDLGMGKTTFSRGFIRAMGHEGAVKSPTYTLVEPYEHLQPPVYHFDLYRVADPEELEYMGIRDYFRDRNLCLIEWAERGTGILPPPDIEVSLSRNGTGRTASVRGLSATGQQLVNELAALESASGE